MRLPTRHTHARPPRSDATYVRPHRQVADKVAVCLAAGAVAPLSACGGFNTEYYQPFTAQALGGRPQSWTAAVALDLAFPLRPGRHPVRDATSAIVAPETVKLPPIASIAAPTLSWTCA